MGSSKWKGDQQTLPYSNLFSRLQARPSKSRGSWLNSFLLTSSFLPESEHLLQPLCPAHTSSHLLPQCNR